MIVDFRNAPAHAKGFDILDAATGENINHLGIVFADDQSNILLRRAGYGRVHRLGPEGGAFVYGERRDILIVPKARRS